MTAWPFRPLGELCTQITVGYVGKMADQYVESGVPFLRSQDIYAGRIDTSRLKYISNRFHDKINKSRLSPGDVGIVRTGYPGTASVVPNSLPESNCSDLVIARPGPDLDPHYLAFLLNSPWGKAMINGRLVGAAQQHFNVSVAKALEIPTPPIIEQRRIAGILGAYDELVEINRRSVATLDELARGLFEEWFIRLRFPGHKTGTADHSSARNLPRGWRRVVANEVFDLGRGRSYRSTELATAGGMPFINLKCITRDGGFRSSGIKRYTGEYKHGHIVEFGDIVMAVTDMTQDRRVVGRVARIPLLDEARSVISMDLVKVMPKEGVDPIFLYSWMRFSDFGLQAAQRANGANVLHLKPADVADLPIELPPPDLQKKFGTLVGPIMKRAEVLLHSDQRLNSSRNLLVPRLMSGRLSGYEIEQDLDAA